MTDENTDWASLLDEFECEDCEKALAECVCNEVEYEFIRNDEGEA